MWIERWKTIVWHPAVRPGIWRRKEGGFLLSTQLRDPKGRRVTAQKTVGPMAIEEAQREIDVLRLERRDELSDRKRSRTSFGAFTLSVFRAKVASRDIRSSKGVEKWKTTLEKHVVPRLGTIPCDELRHGDLAAWRVELAARVAAPERLLVETRKAQSGDRASRGGVGPAANGASPVVYQKWVRNSDHLSPRTVNGWFSILRVITKRMVAELDLHRDPSVGLANFSTLEHPTYTDEKPNALTQEEARRFMAEMRASYPQHYAMTVLGLATGLRPSTLRPLRRKGPEADIDQERGILRVRRSNSTGASTMASTKTGKHQTIHLPPELVAVLSDQMALVEALEADGLKKSELIFPSDVGGFRSRSALDKPFRAVSMKIGLLHAITPRAMRRTFNDLMRLAGVADVVARSISGHATEKMQGHYSTAQAEEQRAGLAKVVRLVASRRTGT